MQDDKYLLEMAAKAAEIDLWPEEIFTNGLTRRINDHGVLCWNPLFDDGDCARLETALGLTVDIGDTGVIVSQGMLFDVLARYSDHGGDRNKARRFASVSVAAAIGEGMG